MNNRIKTHQWNDGGTTTSTNNNIQRGKMRYKGTTNCYQTSYWIYQRANLYVTVVMIHLQCTYKQRSSMNRTAALERLNVTNFSVIEEQQQISKSSVITPNTQQQKSLHYVTKKKEAERIDAENKKLMKSINNQ